MYILGYLNQAHRFEFHSEPTDINPLQTAEFGVKVRHPCEYRSKWQSSWAGTEIGCDHLVRDKIDSCSLQ